MKYIGVTCNVDELGRVVIPKEIRRHFKMDDGVSSFEFFMEDDQIVLRRYPEEDPTGSLGIARRIDRQGRVVIPSGIRDTLDIVSSESSLDVYVRDDNIILRKHDERCIFCSNLGEVKFKGRMLCRACAEEISKLS